MKLHITQSEGRNLITGHDEDYIEINRQRINSSLIVTASTVFPDWKTTTNQQPAFDNLTESDFGAIALSSPEIVLLGSGKTHRFLHPKIYAALTHKGIPLECMSTAAACRTYNILMSEGRNVTAMLLI